MAAIVGSVLWLVYLVSEEDDLWRFSVKGRENESEVFNMPRSNHICIEKRRLLFYKQFVSNLGRKLLTPAANQKLAIRRLSLNKIPA